MIKRSLRVNFSWVLLGTLLFGFSQWALLVVAARYGSPTGLGDIGLALAVTTPLFQGANLQLRAIMATDSSSQFTFGQYAKLRVFAIGLALLVVVAYIGISDTSRSLVLVLIPLCLARTFGSLSDLLYGAAQRNDRLDLTGRSNAIRGLLGLGVFSTLLVTTSSIEAAIGGLAVAWCLVLCLHDLPSMGRYAHRRRNKSAEWRPHATNEGRSFRRLVSLAVPLGVTAVLLSASFNVPQYFVAAALGKKDVGILAALASCMFALNRIVAALGEAASPRLADFRHQGEFQEFRRLVCQMLLLAFFLGGSALVAATLFGREILGLLYGPRYETYQPLLVLLMAAAAIQMVASPLGYALTALRRFSVQSAIQFTGVLATVFLSAVLVDARGLEGAGYAYLFAWAVITILTAAATFRALRTQAAPRRSECMLPVA